MVFSSIVFLTYFLPLFILVYSCVRKKLKNPLILLGSILFYAWAAPKFTFVILGTTLIDFLLVRKMDAAAAPKLRKILLGISITINLGLLFYFKYSNFFVDQVNYFLLGFNIDAIKWTRLVLPVGISFYTFETITYVVDVYRKTHKPLKNFWDYQLYIILFPKLIAGPIIRFGDFAAQIQDHFFYENADNRLRGLYRFFIGLSKKVLIANIIGVYADDIFALPTETLGTYTAWAGALAYTFQIYFDFSGYSDMAIGLALMMGFRFPENFNNPYTASSVTDFWRRWHITLGAWMKQYLYIPLGGNRVKSPARIYLNLCVVFIASGLWHGAAWGFVVWGAYHGFFLVLERAFLSKWLAWIGRFSIVYTFTVVLVGWVFFKLENLEPAIQYLKRMFGSYGNEAQFYLGREFYIIAAVAAFFSFFTITETGKKIQDYVYNAPYNVKKHLALSLATMMLLVLTVSHIATANFNPFIYFRF